MRLYSTTWQRLMTPWPPGLFEGLLNRVNTVSARYPVSIRTLLGSFEQLQTLNKQSPHGIQTQRKDPQTVTSVILSMVHLPPRAFLRFATLWKCLKTLSNRLSSIFLTLIRRLFGGLLNILHPCFPRNTICSFLGIYRPADGLAGVAAISLRGVQTVPTNISSRLIDQIILT
jgi:hypothetical protein